MVKASITCERSLFMDVSFWTFSFYKIKWLASYSLPELKDMYMHVSLPLPLSQRWWQPTPLLLPGKSHKRRSLVGCSPWGWELDTTERLHFHFSLSCVGEGNGSPPQGSCLENPREDGAWWAAIYGVAQSRTRLKRQLQQQPQQPSLLLFFLYVGLVINVA